MQCVVGMLLRWAGLLAGGTVLPAGERAGQAASEQSGDCGAGEEGSWMAAAVVANLVEQVAGLAVVEPSGRLLGGVGAAANQVGRDALLVTVVGHRPQLPAEGPETVGRPALLLFGLLPGLSGGFLDEVARLPAGFGNHLTALVQRLVRQLGTGLLRVAADADGSIAGLPGLVARWM